LDRKGHKNEKAARYVVGHLDQFLSAAQLGITLASLGLGWIGEPVFSALLHPVLKWMHISDPRWQHYISFAFGFSALTFLHIVTGEQAPKMLAIQKPLPTSLWVAYPLLWFYKMSFPFIWVLNHSSQWLLRRMGIESVSEHEMHSEEELRLLFATAQKHSGSSVLGRDIVLNALDLRRRTVRDVMRPRQEIVALSTEMSVSECLDVAEKTRYSRFPLADEGDLDKTLGVVHFKDLFAMRMKVKSAKELIPTARKLIFVPETARLEKVLQLLLERKLHMALVVDEYGGTVGLITLENIVEEIVGPIQDEFDQEKPLLVKKNEKTWEIDGLLPSRDLAELVGMELAEEGVTTVGGWVTHKLGGFPKEGDVVSLGNFELRVEDMDGVRVAKLTLVQKVEAAPQ
jgi:CBS domain containing-hemolysin-like protein